MSSSSKISRPVKVTTTAAARTTTTTTPAPQQARPPRKQQQRWQPVAGGRHCHCHCAEFGVDVAYAYYDLDAARSHQHHHQHPHHHQQQQQPQHPQHPHNRHHRQQQPQQQHHHHHHYLRGTGHGTAGQPQAPPPTTTTTATSTTLSVRIPSKQRPTRATANDNDSFLVVSSSDGESGDFLHGHEGDILEAGGHSEPGKESVAQQEEEEEDARTTTSPRRSHSRRPLSPSKRKPVVATSPSRSHRDEVLAGVNYQHKIIEIRKLIRKLRTEHCTCKKPTGTAAPTSAGTFSRSGLTVERKASLPSRGPVSAGTRISASLPSPVRYHRDEAYSEFHRVPLYIARPNLFREYPISERRREFHRTLDKAFHRIDA